MAMLPMLQSRRYHREELSQLRQLKDREIELIKRFHRESMAFERDKYQEAYTVANRCYEESMALRVHLARRETMRDVWQQRTLLNQTLVIITGLMFASAFEALSQGVIPVGTHTWLLYSYSITLSAAVGLLIVAIWCSFKLQARMMAYNMGDPNLVYNCGKRHLHFNSYFDCHCRHIQRIGIFLFYSGTSVVLLAAASLQTAKCLHVWHDNASAVIFIAIILVPIAVIIMGRRLVPSKSHNEVIDYGGLIGVTEQDNEATERLKKDLNKASSPY